MNTPQVTRPAKRIKTHYASILIQKMEKEGPKRVQEFKRTLALFIANN